MPHTSLVPLLPVDSQDWSPSQARRWLATVPADPAATGRPISDWLAVRWPWQCRVYDSGLPPETRREWGMVVLECTDVMSGHAGHEAWAAATDKAMLRGYVIRTMGAVAGSELWEPGCLARDVLAALVLTVGEAAELAADWRSLPRARVLELSRHRSLIAALDLVIDKLDDGPERAAVAEWQAMRGDLP